MRVTTLKRFKNWFWKRKATKLEHCIATAASLLYFWTSDGPLLSVFGLFGLEYWVKKGKSKRLAG